MTSQAPFVRIGLIQVSIERYKPFSQKVQVLRKIGVSVSVDKCGAIRHI